MDHNSLIICVVSILILLIIITTHVHKKGKAFYTDRETKNKSRAKIYDIGIENTPNLSQYTTFDKIISIITMILPFLFGINVFFEYLGMFVVVILLRCIFIPLTILPKEKHCDDTELKMHNYVNGHCYDKIFSGHFASIVLLALIVGGKGLVDKSVLVIGCLLYAFIIISLRYHYTADLAVGALIALVVYQNKMSVTNLFNM